MPTISLRKLDFCYPSAPDHPVLKDFNLEIQDGEFVCVIGSSGCGKSTLLRLLAGLEKAELGSITINGNVVTAPGSDRMIVFQDYTLFPWQTARRNIQFAVQHTRRNLCAKDVRLVCDSFLDKVGMLPYADRYPCQLSGGMRQRVAIARALAMDTEILLLDEPFGALDVRIRAELQRTLEQLWNNHGERRKTVIFVTHDISEAILLADRIIILQSQGRYQEINVKLPRPRSGIDTEKNSLFIQYRHQLMGLLHANNADGDSNDTE